MKGKAKEIPTKMEEKLVAGSRKIKEETLWSKCSVSVALSVSDSYTTQSQHLMTGKIFARNERHRITHGERNASSGREKLNGSMKFL